MDQEPGSGPSKIDGPSGGGSTSVSDKREDERDSEQVDGSQGTDDSNRGTGVSGLQTTEDKGDTDSKADRTSEQAGPSFVAVSTGNDGNQQASEEWTMVDPENSGEGAVEKGEGCTQAVAEVGQKIVSNTELVHKLRQDVYDSRHLVDSSREKTSKDGPVVAKVAGTEVKCATDANEVDAQVRLGSSPETPRASSQASPSAVALPDVVASSPQGAQMLSKSGSAKEGRPQPHSLRQIGSKMHMLQTTSETLACSNSKRESSTGGVIPSTGLVSGSQKESKENSEAASTASSADAQVETDMTQGDPRLVSASVAQEVISGVSKAPITVESDSGQLEVGGSCAVLPRTVPRSRSRKEALTSPKVVSEVSASEAQEEKISEAAKAPITAVMDSGSQEEPSSCAVLPRTVSRSGSRKEALTSPKVVSEVSASEAQEEKISEAAKAPITAVMDSGSQEEPSSCAVLPRTVSRSGSRKEALTSPKVVSKVSASEAQEEKISEAAKAPITAVMDSGSQEEPSSCAVLPRTVSRSGSRKEALTSPKVVSEVSASEAQEEKISEAAKAPITAVMDSGSQEEPSSCAVLPRTVSRSGSRKEALTSPKVVSKVSASEAQEEKISEAAKAPITAVMDSGSQEEPSSCAVLPRTVSRSGSREELLTSPEVVSKVSASEAEEDISEAAKAPITVELDSGHQEETGSCAERPRAVPRSDSCMEPPTRPKVESKASDSGIHEEAGSCADLLRTVPRSDSPKEAPTSPKDESKASDSGTQEEAGLCAESPRAVSGSDSPKEALRSPKAESKFSDPGTQEKSNEAVESANTVVLGSGPQEAVLRPGLEREVSRSKSRKEVGTSPEAAGTTSGSDAEGGSSVASEASSSVLDAVVQEDVHSLSEVLSLSEVNGGSVETEVLSTESSCEGSKDADTTSSESSTTMRTSAEIVNKLSTDSVVRNEVGDPSSGACAREVSEVSETLSTVAKVPALESFGSKPAENVPRPEDLNKLPALEGFGANPEENVPRPEAPSKVPAPESFGTNPDDNVSRPEASSKVAALESVGTKPEENVPRAEDLRKLPAPESLETKPEENVPRAETSSKVPEPGSLGRTASQAGRDSLRKPPQTSAHQSETTGSGVPEGLPRRTSAGGGPRVPERNATESDPFLSTTPYFVLQEKLAKSDIIIEDLKKRVSELNKTVSRRDLVLIQKKGAYQALEQNCTVLELRCTEWRREYEGLKKTNAELVEANQDLEQARYKSDTDVNKCLRHIRDLNAKLELVIRERGTLKAECATLQEQLSAYEQQHASEQSIGGSYLDDTKAATPALLVSALNGVKDASSNFVKVLRSSIQPGIFDADVRQRIGAVSRAGHIKFQFQAYVCRMMFDGFEHPAAYTAAGVPSKAAAYFRHYQLHDMKKTDTLDKLLSCHPEIDPSLSAFCFDKFARLMEDVQHLLVDQSVDLRQVVLRNQHPRACKLYVSFCKLAVSVWLLQRLAHSFLQPARTFIAPVGEPFDQSRMQSVVPLDEPGADEEVELRVSFYVLPGFDIGKSAVPCEVYVTAST